MSRRIPELDEAITRLANEFENGNLMAATDPVGFIDMIADDIAALRSRLAAVEEKVEKQKELIDFYDAKLASDFVDKDVNDYANRRARLAITTVIMMLKAKRDAIAETECNGDSIVTKMKWGKFDLIQSIIEEVESIKGGF